MIKEKTVSATFCRFTMLTFRKLFSALNQGSLLYTSQGEYEDVGNYDEETFLLLIISDLFFGQLLGEDEDRSAKF